MAEGLNLPSVLELAARLKRLAGAATPGPWHTCGEEAKCSCKLISCGDHPVAAVTCGEWGDDFPDLRLTDPPGTIGNKVEPFINRIAYGVVSEERAAANACLIAACSPDRVIAIAEAVERMAAVALAAQHLRKQIGDSAPQWASSLSNAMTLDLFAAVDALGRIVDAERTAEETPE